MRMCSDLLFISSHMFSMTQKIQASSVLSVSETCLRLMDQNWTLTSWRFFLPWLTEMLTERSATRILLTWWVLQMNLRWGLKNFWPWTKSQNMDYSIPLAWECHQICGKISMPPTLSLTPSFALFPCLFAILSLSFFHTYSNSSKSLLSTTVAGE